jgi:tetratricopeptide (TPR) repeat protein
MLFKQNQEAQ